MGTVISNASMSLDGFIARNDNTVGPLFDWYDAGDVEVRTAHTDLTFHLTERSAEHWRTVLTDVGALVVGRTLFDVTDGWGGRHPLDVPVVVLTHRVPQAWVDAHPDAPFTFVTTGIEDAVGRARELADGGDVSVAAGTVALQCLEAGLLDAVAIDLVPVVMGEGRPYFGRLRLGDVRLGNPTICIPSERVTHLVLPVQR